MRVLTLASLALIFVFMAAGSPAIAAPQNPNPDITHRELANFDHFLDGHPAIERELTHKPGLVNDSRYINSHPELKEFLATHPGVREEIKETPRYFMERERRFDKSGKDITRAEVAGFDQFLDKHPAIDKELRNDPALIRNPEYLSRHPELREFLNLH